MRDSVNVQMAAAPEKVWALVSDVTRIGEFSPETFEAEWLEGATAPVVGARFRGHVRRNGRGPVYWTTCKVLECEANRRFTFGVVVGDKVMNTWGYELEPKGEGTEVTEFYDLGENLPMKLYWAVMGKARGRTNRNGMQATLDRIKAVVERP